MKNNDYSSYWLGEVDWGQASGSHNTNKYHSQVGASIISTSVQERALSITGWVLDAGENTLQERCDFLNAFISPVEDYSLEYNGKKIGFRPDSSIVYSPEYKKNNEKVRRFLIQATCPFPLFSDIEYTEIPFDRSRKLFHFKTGFGRKKPLVFAVIDKAHSITVMNPGGFSTGFIVRIRFSGEVHNPKVWNIVTGKFIGVNYAFARGQQLELCTISGNKHITLYNEENEEIDLIKERDFQSSFNTQLQPGKNIISVECENQLELSNMDLTLYYSPLYLEVR